MRHVDLAGRHERITIPHTEECRRPDLHISSSSYARTSPALLTAALSWSVASRLSLVQDADIHPLQRLGAPRKTSYFRSCMCYTDEDDTVDPPGPHGLPTLSLPMSHP